jgi:hypothetical protein
MAGQQTGRKIQLGKVIRNASGIIATAGTLPANQGEAICRPSRLGFTNPGTFQAFRSFATPRFARDLAARALRPGLFRLRAIIAAPERCSAQSEFEPVLRRLARL